mgnify:CR=1 FL=1
MANTKKMKKEIPQKIIDGNYTDEELEVLQRDDSKYRPKPQKDGISYGRAGRPTQAQIELLKQYKAHNPADIVKNSIDEVLLEELPYIKKAIENFETYGDKHVYSVLPKELDKFNSEYALIISEYFGKGNPKLRSTPVVVFPETYKRCDRCLKYKDMRSNFYESTLHIGDGYVSVCIDCANKMLNEYYLASGDIRESIMLLSQKLDLYVETAILDRYTEFFDTVQGKECFTAGTFFEKYLSDIRVYIQHNNLQKEELGFANTFFGGVPFKNLNKYNANLSVYEDTLVSMEEVEEDSEEVKGYKKLIKKWGIEDRKDLRFLENRYQELDEEYDLSGLSTQMLVKQLCFEELKLTQIRKESGDSKKNIDSMRALMADLALTPKKVKKGESSAFASFSNAIKAFETEQPIIGVNPAFKDVDDINKIKESMIGALSRTLNLDNEYIKKFKEHYAPYSVDLTEDDYDEDTDDI